MATNVRSVHPSPSTINAVHRKQSQCQQVTSCICLLFCASARYKHPGQATRDACSRRDRGEDSTSANPMRSSKVRYLRGAGRLGQRGGMGRGEKYRDVYLRKFQRSPKAIDIASSRQRWVPREGRSQSASSVPRSISFQGRSGYLGPVISRVPCGKRESGFATLRDCNIT